MLTSRIGRSQVEGFSVWVFGSLGLSVFLALMLAGCSGSSDTAARGGSRQTNAGGGTAAGSEKVVNVYNWADFIDPAVITGFEKEYGIKVNYDVFDASEILETKLLAGHSNYDVVFPSGAFLEREIKADVYQKLDKAQLPNLKNLDPEVNRSMGVLDPGNQYAVDYMWLTTTGIAYNIPKIKARMADAPVDSWRLLFDPAVLAKFQDCGVTVLDAPQDVVSSVLFFLGKNPNSESPEDLKAVEHVLVSIRPYIRYADSVRYIGDLANGDICLALGWSGDATQARRRAKEAGKDVQLAYSIPKEGALMGFDSVAIPADAPHPGNAHLFINYLLRADVAAKNSNAVSYANPVPASLALLDETLRSDPGVYPPPEVRARAVAERAKSAEFNRLLMRTWTRFKTNK
jgi:putrescine transport system substrate-binding protein